MGPPKTGGSWWRGLTECDPLEKGMANHISILALRTPWTVWKGKMIEYWRKNSPRSVGAQHATGDQWRNNSRKNDGMEPKQKQYPVVDVTGDRSKVRCCNWCWEGLGVGGEGDDRGWDGWMASLTRWTWVWVNSGSWWWTGRPGMLQFMGSQRVGHDWATELNWTELKVSKCEFYSDAKKIFQNFSLTQHFNFEIQV